MLMGGGQEGLLSFVVTASPNHAFYECLKTILPLNRIDYQMCETVYKL
jgi:hypothetical protein